MFLFCFLFPLKPDVRHVLNAVTQQVQFQSSRTHPHSQVPVLLSGVRRLVSFCRHTKARQGKLSALRSQGLVQVSKRRRKTLK